MKWIDRVFIALQAIAGFFQVIGTFMYTDFGSNLFAWSLSGALVPVFLVALNILRHRRDIRDRAIAYLCLGGNFAWGCFILLFGKTQGNIFDARILLHAVAAFALAILALRVLSYENASER